MKEIVNNVVSFLAYGWWFSVSVILSVYFLYRIYILKKAGFDIRPFLKSLTLKMLIIIMGVIISVILFDLSFRLAA